MKKMENDKSKEVRLVEKREDGWQVNFASKMIETWPTWKKELSTGSLVTDKTTCKYK